MLPAVSIKKCANPMSLLKADMPIGYKDPTKDVDDGMAGGYSELKEPGEEGEDRHHSEEDERLAQNWSCLSSREDILSTLTGHRLKKKDKPAVKSTSPRMVGE